MILDAPIIVVAIAVLLVLWITAIAMHRVDGRVTLRGLRNGALIAAALFAITVVIVTLVFNGRAVFVDRLDLAGAFELGMLVGAVVAVGYLWLGAVLIAIGLIFKSKPQWTTLGAWAAVPIIVMAGGFGYASYKSVNSDSAAASSANGSLHLALSGAQTARVSADGAATCARDADGTLTISAGTSADPHLISTDGRLISTQIVTAGNGAAPALQLEIDGVDTSGVTVASVLGASAPAGQLTLSAPTWTGTLAWSCNL